MASIADRLRDRLNKEFNLNIPENVKPERCYYGYWQKASGAWSWNILGNNLHYYGSQWNMKKVLTAKFITLYKEHTFETSILVVDEKEYKEWKENN